MNDQVLLLPLESADDVETLGAKGSLTHWLLKHTRQVPRSFILPGSVHAAYQQDPQRTLTALGNSLPTTLDGQRHYAVRSSSSLEDQAASSYAGQFTSVLDVRGFPDLLDAIQQVFDSLSSEQVKSYQARVGQSRTTAHMAVLIQEMVTPVVAGVAASRNPLTGLNEVMIEAVEGSGEALVQAGATPDHWVYKWGRFMHKPADPILDNEIVTWIATETERLAEAFGSPVDLEWVYNGEQVYWVQIRPLTALDDIAIYSNRISREFLPGLIKPLIWSVNVPLVNRAWIQLFEEMIGNTSLEPEDLAKSFYYRAYFNMGSVGRIFQLLGFPRDSLEMLMGFEKTEGMPGYRPSLKTLRYTPHVLRFLLSLWRYPRRLDADLRELQESYQAYKGQDLESMDELSLLQAYDQLYALNLRLAYHNILVPVMMSVFNGLLKRQLVARGIDPLQFDWADSIEEIVDYDPLFHLDELSRKWRDLPPTLQTDFEKALSLSRDTPPGLGAFTLSFEAFLEKFGHFGESGNDFSSVPWRENPQWVLEMIRNHTPKSSEGRLGWSELKLKPLAMFMVRLFGRRTRRYILERERVSSLYTFGYGLFRDIFLALGGLYAQRGVLDQVEDIFYLTLDEVRAVSTGANGGSSLQKLITERKQEMEISTGLIMPEIIYGEQAPPLETFTTPESGYHGMPTSRGYCRGRVTVIESLSEMEKLQDGDVLVIPYSDVAWTPLFARAGAVIAQSGGVLSHSSIVAREMGIPCVVSVPNACQLKDGTLVIVDGHRGEISVLEEKA